MEERIFYIDDDNEKTEIIEIFDINYNIVKCIKDNTKNEITCIINGKERKIYKNKIYLFKK